jgi:hypothetical protein
VDALAASYFRNAHPHHPLFTPRTFRLWQTRLLEAQDPDNVSTSICLCVYALGALSGPNKHQKAPESLGLEYFQPGLKIILRELLWGFRPNVMTCQALLLAASYFAHLGRPRKCLFTSEPHHWLDSSKNTPVHSLRMSHFASRFLLSISQR